MNEFDTALGYWDDFDYEASDLGLWPFNKIAKAVKKVSSKISKVVKKVTKKAAAFVNSEIGQTIMNGAVMVAGAIGGKAAAEATSKITGKISSYATKINKVVDKVDKVTQKIAGTTAATMNKKIVSGVNTKIARNPKIKRAISSMQAKGRSTKQISQAWVKSQAFDKAASRAVYSTTANAVQGALMKRGMPAKQAEIEAAEIAAPMAKQAVDTVKQKAGGGLDSKALIPMAAAGAALLLMTK
jgi:hypothetical protein